MYIHGYNTKMICNQVAVWCKVLVLDNNNIKKYMKLKELIAELNKNKADVWNGDYHTITKGDVADFLDNYSNTVADDEGFDSGDDVYSAFADSLFENADSETPIYYHGLAEWFGKNWSAVDDYINEYGQPDTFDIMKVIGWAYCMSYERDFTEALKQHLGDIMDNE